MIITVTMNPAIDKTVEISKFEHGGLNRIQNITIDAGGKGINVSKTIHALGGESLAMGFLGGANGEKIRQVLNEQKIPMKFVEINGETRINTKVAEANGCVTELNESGPTISEVYVAKLLEEMEYYLNAQTLVILSGSVPAGIPKDVYGRITEYAHSKDAKVFMDADGELFFNALKAKPDIIKPNKMELEQYLEKRIDTNEAFLNAGKELLEQGIETVIISLGAKGAYFLSKEHTLYSPGLSVKVHSTVGAGDAMVAAFSYGLSQGYEFEECVKLAMATSAGAVTTVGTKPPTKEVVDELLAQVKLTKFV